jgi:hypothetical protein
MVFFGVFICPKLGYVQLPLLGTKPLILLAFIPSGPQYRDCSGSGYVVEIKRVTASRGHVKRYISTMKTNETIETALSEKGIKARLLHRGFQEHAKRTYRFKRKKMKRTMDAVEEGILLLMKYEDQFLEPKVSLHPEFIAYTFHLEGVPRKLLMYIIFYELNTSNCRFILNAQMIYRFHEFCAMFGGKRHPDQVVKQAQKRLVKMNIMTSVERGEYMLNPLIAGGSTESRRRELINQYSMHLIEKGKDTSSDFYPVYDECDKQPHRIGMATLNTEL